MQWSVTTKEWNDDIAPITPGDFGVDLGPSSRDHVAITLKHQGRAVVAEAVRANEGAEDASRGAHHHRDLWAIANWGQFSKQVRVNADLANVPPEPHIGFLLIHRRLAVKMMAKGTSPQ